MAARQTVEKTTKDLPQQADAIHAYIIEQAHEDLQARQGNSVWRSIKQGLYSTLAWVLF